MASVLFSNNASAALASSITSVSTVITVTTGAGAQFPAITGGNYFYATLTDSSNNLEIVKVTARSSDVLTVVRGQEGTTPRAYAAADKLELRVTTAALTEYVTLAIADAVSATKQALYPVGSVYTNSINATNPASLLGFGTWAAFGAGRVPVGFDSTNALFDSAEETGGSADANVVSHTHTYSATTGTESASHTHTAYVTDPGHGHTVWSDDNIQLGTMPGGTSGQRQISNGDLGGRANFYRAVANSTGITVANGTQSASHTHSVSGTTADANIGTSATNKNYQPYITVYMWKRTA